MTVAEPERSIEQLLRGDLDLAVVDVYDRVPVPMPDYLLATELCTEPLVLVCCARSVSGPGPGQPGRAWRSRTG